MADLDLARIKRNVAKMASVDAPVEDIDGYIASEGTTIDAVRAFRAAPPSSPSEPMAPPPADGMDGSGQRYEGGVPVGGRPMPAPAGGSASRGNTIAPPVRKGDGMLANTTAGINEGIYGVAGLPVDLVRGGMNMASRGINAVAGTDLPQIPENSFGGSRWIGETMGEVHPALDPANTVAATPEERVARVGGQGIGGTVAPAGVATGMLRAGMVPARAVPTVEMMAGRTGSAGAAAGDAVAGGAAGIGSGVAMESAPDEWKPTAALAGGVAGGGIGMVATGIPALVREGGRLAARAAEPFTAGGQQRQAARALREGATDPQSILDADVAGAELVPGSMPTTGQLTGDMGTLAMERGSQTRFPAEFNQRRADQNAARVGTLEGIQPGGAPEKVAQSVRSFLQSIDTEVDTAVGSAMEAARASAGRVGAGARPDEAGASVRGALEAARATAKERERALWSAVDPNGTLALRPGNLRRQAAEIINGMPASAKPLAGEQAAILDVIGRYGDVVPFSELAAMKSRLRDEMSEIRSTAGETNAYRLMAQLNSALYQDLDMAVVGRARFEAREVAEGRMAPENTLEAKVQSWTNAWREARGENQASAGAIASGGTRSVSSGHGSGLPPQGRPGGASGDPRLSRDDRDPNFDAAAQERLTAANTATRERAQTFDNPTLGPIRKRPATNAPYDMPASAVPARIFFGRPQSAEAMARYAQAVGPDQARATIEPYAVDQARRAALRDDGTFDPARLDRWRRQHQDALRAMPELDARLADAGRAGETMGEVATAQRQASEVAQKGALGRMVGIDGPEEVTRAVGSLFGRQDGPTQLAAIKRAIGNDPEALEGLRKAVADHVTSRLIGNTEVGTSGVGGIKSDQYQTFVRQNADLLRVVFTPNELRAMEAVASDLQRANRSLVAARIPGQSNTAQDTLAVQSTDAPATMLAKLIGTSAAAGGGVGVATGSMSGIAVGAGTMFAGAMREAGLRRVDELVRDALLAPRKAKILLETVRPDDRAKELGLVRRFRATLPAVGGIAMGATEPEPKRGPMALPDYMRQAMNPPAPAPAPMTSGNPLIDAVAAREQAAPPWMQDGGQVGDLQRALAARGGR